MAASPWRWESSGKARGPEEGWWRENEKITAEGRQSCWGGRGSGPGRAGGSFFCGMARQTDIQTGCPVGKEAEVRGVKRKKAKIKKTMHRRKSFSCSDTVSGSDIAEPAQEKGASLLASTRTRGRRWSRTAFIWTRCVCVFVLCVLLCPCCLRRGLGHTTGQQQAGMPFPIRQEHIGRDRNVVPTPAQLRKRPFSSRLLFISRWGGEGKEGAFSVVLFRLRPRLSTQGLQQVREPPPPQCLGRSVGTVQCSTV